jgi:Acetyltransferase (GNAT) domain
MHAAWEGDAVVGGAGSFPFPMSVPGGGTLRCAGTTVVGVAPTHRRRGMLKTMMRAHLDDAHARGEPLAALWASEETIYGRFGYGRAAFAGEVAIPKEYIDFAAPRERAGTLRIVEADEALETFPPLWEALARERPRSAPLRTPSRSCGVTCSTSIGSRRSPRGCCRLTTRSSSSSRSRGGCATGSATEYG